MCRYIFLIFLFFASSTLLAQDFNEELRNRIREQITELERPQQPQQHAPFQPNQQHQEQEVLRISATTRLPSKFCRIQTLYRPEEMKVNISFKVTNRNRSQVARSQIDYSNGRINPIPDSRSISFNPGTLWDVGMLWNFIP
jgi:transcription initiation factor TFIID subunit TAF12